MNPPFAAAPRTEARDHDAHADEAPRPAPNGHARAQSTPPPLDSELPMLVEGLLESYRGDRRGHHINRRFLPSRDEIIDCCQILLQLFYPGYFGRQDLTDENVGYHVGGLLSTLREKMARQIEMSLCCRSECEQQAAAPCANMARKLAVEFLRRLAGIRQKLLDDVQAAFDGDPAAANLDEVILAYPGLLAITVYRVAHELHGLGVPLMPRIMTEWAHAQTGADIHPGADIGPSFFVDHATGVVVGETSRIGANVKLYQGVTLGALSVPKDGRGRAIRGTKRHPTVEDGVTIYANATVLGGTTVLGEESVIGGSVFVTKSVPAGSRVAVKPPELRVALPKDARV
ncbi:MAG TPA: serine O-acetyltransferase, partial [Byssovorax sp.]